MSERDGLMITGHGEKQDCVCCSKSKECLFVESTDGSINGWLCFNHLKMMVRLRQLTRPHQERETPLFDAEDNHRDPVRSVS